MVARAGVVIGLACVCFVVCAQAQQRRPNVLFIVCDDLNLSLGCYGNTVVKTPNIDRLAARGERFERAYANYPLCLPSRNSFLSGRRPTAVYNQGGLLRDNLKKAGRDQDLVFLPEQFRRNGYFTARVGKLFHVTSVLKHDPVLEFDDPACWDISELGGTRIDPDGYSLWFASVPEALAAHPNLQSLVAEHQVMNRALVPAYDYWMERVVLKPDVPEDLTTDGHIAQRTVQLLEEHARGDKPFFLAAGFRRPHHLWVASKKYFDLYDPAKMVLPPDIHGPRDPSVPKLAYTRGAPNMTDDQRRLAIASYYACVSEADANVGLVLDAMDRLKLWDNTVVLLTSDHGWHLGEHGLWGKVTLFQEGSRVPLIIAAPGVTVAGSVSPRAVEMIDFFPTLTELCGVPKPREIEGRSIVPVLKDANAEWNHSAFVVVRRGKVWGRAVNTEKWRFCEGGVHVCIEE
jgi:iduronate 2-sulfatase